MPLSVIEKLYFVCVEFHKQQLKYTDKIVVFFLFDIYDKQIEAL